MDVFLDTSLIVSLLIETDKTQRATKFFDDSLDSFIASVSVFEETFYVGLRIIAEDKLSLGSPFALRKHIRKNGYVFAEDFIDTLNKIFESIEVINDIKNSRAIVSIAKNYRLLPYDALIAATCKRHGITKIATFDEDFEKLDFLEVIEL